MPRGIYLHRKGIKKPGSGIYNRTEKHRLSLSLSHKGKRHSKETIEKMKESSKGQIFSEKSKMKMSLAHKGKKRKPHTKEAKLKISIGNKGKVVSKETREKMSLLAKKRIGSKSPNWQGGISNDPYSNDWTNTLKESIRQRDAYICQECGIHQDEYNFKLDIHHIDYDKENCDPNNLITLCRNCHAKTNFNREYWKNIFNNLIK